MANILVVDDEEDLRELLNDLLVGHGHTVTLAANGSQGIACLARPAHGFDLVITDMYMPERDGLEVVMTCARQKLPVIAMSGGGSERAAHFDALPTASLLGAVTTIHKPFTMEYMAAVVDTVLKLQG